MEYVEMPTAPKAMFDKLLSSESLTRAPFSTNGLVGTGYRPMPLPVFSHSKSATSASLPGSGVVPPFVTTGMSVNGSQIGPLSTAGSGASVGIIQLSKLGDTGSSLQGDGSMEKGKRNIKEGGRGSRGGGSNSRKRSRGWQTPDPSVTVGSPPDAGLAVGACSSVKHAPGNGARQRTSISGDKGEKSTSRRQSGQGTKRSDKKGISSVPATVGDQLQLINDTNAASMFPNSGILDIYGIRTRPVNVARYLLRIPLSDLLADNVEVPRVHPQDYQVRKVENDGWFEQQISSVLSSLPKNLGVGETYLSVPGDGIGKGSMLPNESKAHQGENGPDRLGPREVETKSNLSAAFKVEVDAEKEIRCGADGVLAVPLSAPVRKKFSVDALPLYPAQDFLSRLKLGPSEGLESLIAQASADGEVGWATDIQIGGGPISSYHKTGSIPPLPFSFPHVGPLRTELESEKRLKTVMSNYWNCRGPTVENIGRKACAGLDKEELDGTGGDAMVKCANSRHKKMDFTSKAGQDPSCNSVPPSSPPLSHIGLSLALTNPVKEEARQVDNAIGRSSEGHSNPMEIDSGRVDNGAGSFVAERSVKLSVGTHTGNDQQRRDGDAVRPLEIQATLSGPHDVDSGTRQSKAMGTSLLDAKQEPCELEMKDKGESSKGTTSQDFVVFKKEGSWDLPTLDIKVNSSRSTSTHLNELPSASPVMPNSPGVQAAARLLCNMANSSPTREQEKHSGDRDRRRRVFQSYPGAPVQKSSKSLRISNSNGTGEAGRDGKASSDGGMVPPSKALLSERRKSLSQVNDASDRPSVSPRNSMGGLSSSSRGVLTGSRSSSLSLRAEKSGRDHPKEFVCSREGPARVSSLPPLSASVSALKSKGVKTNGFVTPTNGKGGAGGASTNFSRVHPTCNPQRISSGGSSRSSRPSHTGNTLASHGPSSIPLKLRPSVPETRHKSKPEAAVRGSKPNRD